MLCIVDRCVIRDAHDCFAVQMVDEEIILSSSSPGENIHDSQRLYDKLGLWKSPLYFNDVCIGIYRVYRMHKFMAGIDSSACLILHFDF